MFDRYVEIRLAKGISYLKSFDLNNWKANSTVITIEFFPIMYELATGECFIPTGSKDMPAGISTLKDDYILFYPKEKKGASFYCELNSIKEYLRHNHTKLKQEMDDDYKTLGYRIKIRDINAFFEKTPFCVISQ